MKIRKIAALAVGAAMVGATLGFASAAAANYKVPSGMKDPIGNVPLSFFVNTTTGQPNVQIVVGANAPSTMDVVSAADIAAAIGGIMYKSAQPTIVIKGQPKAIKEIPVYNGMMGGWARVMPILKYAQVTMVIDGKTYNVNLTNSQSNTFTVDGITYKILGAYDVGGTSIVKVQVGKNVYYASAKGEKVYVNGEFTLPFTITPPTSFKYTIFNLTSSNAFLNSYLWKTNPLILTKPSIDGISQSYTWNLKDTMNYLNGVKMSANVSLAPEYANLTFVFGENIFPAGVKDVLIYNASNVLVWNGTTGLNDVNVAYNTTTDTLILYHVRAGDHIIFYTNYGEIDFAVTYIGQNDATPNDWIARLNFGCCIPNAVIQSVTSGGYTTYTVFDLHYNATTKKAAVQDVTGYSNAFLNGKFSVTVSDIDPIQQTATYYYTSVYYNASATPTNLPTGTPFTTDVYYLLYHSTEQSNPYFSVKVGETQNYGVTATQEIHVLYTGESALLSLHTIFVGSGTSGTVIGVNGGTQFLFPEKINDPNMPDLAKQIIENIPMHSFTWAGYTITLKAINVTSANDIYYTVEISGPGVITKDYVFHWNGSVVTPNSVQLEANYFEVTHVLQLPTGNYTTSYSPIAISSWTWTNPVTLKYETCSGCEADIIIKEIDLPDVVNYSSNSPLPTATIKIPASDLVFKVTYKKGVGVNDTLYVPYFDKSLYLLKVENNSLYYGSESINWYNVGQSITVGDYTVTVRDIDITQKKVLFAVAKSGETPKLYSVPVGEYLIITSSGAYVSKTASIEAGVSIIKVDNAFVGATQETTAKLSIISNVAKLTNGDTKFISGYTTEFKVSGGKVTCIKFIDNKTISNSTVTLFNKYQLKYVYEPAGEKAYIAILNVGAKPPVYYVKAGETIPGTNYKVCGVENYTVVNHLTTPITVLDTDLIQNGKVVTDKNLILVGGPVANEITKMVFEKMGLPTTYKNFTAKYDNSPVLGYKAECSVTDGKGIIVVAGANRDATAMAAEELMKYIATLKP